MYGRINRATVSLGLLLTLWSTPKVSLADEQLSKIADNLEQIKKALSDKKVSSDDIGKGTYVKYGISGGVALGVLSMAPWEIQNRSLFVGTVTAMPYIVLNPAYWRMSKDTSREYCAARWLGKEHLEASNAAAAAARIVAKQKYEEVSRALRYIRDCNIEPGKTFCANYGLNSAQLDWAQRIQKIDELQDKTPKQIEENEKDRNDLIDDMRRQIWTTDRVVPCSHYHIGLWFGLAGTPTVASIRSYVNPGDNYQDERRTIIPIFAAGLAYSPITYFSLLAGLSYSIFEEPQNSATKTFHLVSPMLGFGGSLEIFSVGSKK